MDKAIKINARDNLYCNFTFNYDLTSFIVFKIVFHPYIFDSLFAPESFVEQEKHALH